MTLDIRTLYSKLEDMDTDEIDRLTEDEVPIDELEEVYAVEDDIYCPGCRVIPHPNPEGCLR